MAPRQDGDFVDPEPGATVRRVTQMSPPQWVLPKKYAELYQIVATSLPGGLSVETGAPLTTVMEVLRRPKTQEVILHLVNFSRQALRPFNVLLNSTTVAAVSP